MNSSTTPDALSESLSGDSPRGVARRLGIGIATVFRAIGSGALPARKIGRRTVVLAVDERAWLDSLPRAGRAHSAPKSTSARRKG